MNLWNDIERIGGDRDGPPDAGDIQASMAVSLKRIADALTTFDMDGLRNQLVSIAYEVGVSFRGRQ